MRFVDATLRVCSELNQVAATKGCAGSQDSDHHYPSANTQILKRRKLVVKTKTNNRCYLSNTMEEGRIPCDESLALPSEVSFSGVELSHATPASPLSVSPVSATGQQATSSFPSTSRVSGSKRPRPDTVDEIGDSFGCDDSLELTNRKRLQLGSADSPMEDFGIPTSDKDDGFLNFKVCDPFSIISPVSMLAPIY